MNIILDTHGLALKKKSGSFHIVLKNMSKYISPMRVDSITIASNCIISSPAVELAIKHEIPIIYRSNTGKVYGKVYSQNYVGHQQLRIQQIFFQWSGIGLAWVKNNLILKSNQQLKYLNKYISDERDKQALASQTELFTSELLTINDGVLKNNLNQLLILEAKMGKRYWKMYRKCLPSKFSMKNRKIRPAQDPVNASLNYFYGFYYSMIEHTIYMTGLDPHISLYHQNKYNSKVLSFDLIEPFRPFVDNFVLQLCLNEELDMRYFTFRDAGCELNKKGKKILIPTFYDLLESSTKFNGTRTSLRNHIYRYTQALKNEISKIDIDEYISQL